MVSMDEPIRIIAGVWDNQFVDLVSSAQDRLVLCSPYVSQDGAETVARARTGKAQIGIRSFILTDLSPRAVCAGATDPDAVMNVANSLAGGRVVHLPRLHAKVYVADGQTAVVTSGNLTSGGLGRNYEYGVLIRDCAMASSIEADMLEYAGLGAEMHETTLAKYCQAAADARKAYREHVASTSRTIQRRLASALRAADESLIRARLAGGAMHTVFAKTVMYLLHRHGPLTTKQQHPLVQRLHPDLCDDSVDRVIDGKHFGKKWKHAVRTAQQALKKQGRIEQRGDLWYAMDAPSTPFRAPNTIAV